MLATKVMEEWELPQDDLVVRELSVVEAPTEERCSAQSDFVNNGSSINAKRMLNGLRIRNVTSGQEHKIIVLSERSCTEETCFRFTLKQSKEDGSSHPPIELTVYEYFVTHRKMHIEFSKHLPCINFGKPKHPTYLPFEHCKLVSLQRYTKALKSLQRASLVKKARQMPQERMSTLNKALAVSNYNADPMLGSAGMSISNQFIALQGRILSAPKLQTGSDEFFPRNGHWNFNKMLSNPVKIGGLTKNVFTESSLKMQSVVLELQLLLFASSSFVLLTTKTLKTQASVSYLLR